MIHRRPIVQEGFLHVHGAVVRVGSIPKSVALMWAEEGRRRVSEAHLSRNLTAGDRDLPGHVVRGHSGLAAWPVHPGVLPSVNGPEVLPLAIEILLHIRIVAKTGGAEAFVAFPEESERDTVHTKILQTRAAL
eukprot:scaffold442_cov268-Pinguiococcus_pyrenoidosus.AAC.30